MGTETGRYGWYGRYGRHELSPPGAAADPSGELGGEWAEVGVAALLADRAELRLALEGLWEATLEATLEHAGAAGGAPAREALERAQRYPGAVGLVWGWRDVIRGMIRGGTPAGAG